MRGHVLVLCVVFTGIVYWRTSSIPIGVDPMVVVVSFLTCLILTLRKRQSSMFNHPSIDTMWKAWLQWLLVPCIFPLMIGVRPGRSNHHHFLLLHDLFRDRCVVMEKHMEVRLEPRYWDTVAVVFLLFKECRKTVSDLCSRRPHLAVNYAKGGRYRGWERIASGLFVGMLLSSLRR